MNATRAAVQLAGAALLAWCALSAAAQGFSQATLERDCRQRLDAIVPAGVQVKAVNFSALGQYANYYVVTYRFSGALETTRETGACTYRRNGEWVSDDAASHKLSRQLGRPASPR